MSSILSLPAELGQLVLSFAVAKYIEGAGSAAGAMTGRAQALKAILTEIQGVAKGTITIQQLQQATAQVLASKGVSVSTQLLVNGLLGILASTFPGPTSGLISAAIAADVNVFATAGIAVCNQYIG